MLGRYNSTIILFLFRHKHKIINIVTLLAHVLLFRVRGPYLSFGTLYEDNFKMYLILFY